ncbi:MAG: nucleotide exchange factor GrpE [Gemmatimonadota bacterium]|jgi:molecular chaperone GrpE
MEGESPPEAETEAEVDEDILQEIEDFLSEGEGEDPRPDVEDGAEAESSSEEVDELATTQAELARLRDQHLRLAADFENFRKRANADLMGNWVRARADLVRSLVEGLDDLQRVSRFTSDDTTVEALIEGVDLVERNILKALTDAGLQVLDPEGERFDPNTMEAMMRVPTEEDGQDEIVQQVFQKGYMFKDQLVRPARVSVYKDDD